MAARVVAVDWSGRSEGERRAIWTAEVVDGGLVELRAGRTRAEVVAHLVDLASAGEPLVAGLDFCFSVPAWFARAHGCRDVDDVWALVGKEAETWLRGCEPPFWGRKGRRRPDGGPQFRDTELAVVAIAGVRPKSVFQVGGAGAVGTGSLRGMPHLADLRAAGFAIWPFDGAGRATVVEVWPRLCTGPVVKSDAAARAAHLGMHHPQLPALAASTEDAFDAAVSALVMWQHRHELSNLPKATTEIERLEGRVWVPGSYTSKLPPVRQ